MYVPLTVLPRNLQQTCFEITRMVDERGYLAGGTRGVAQLLAIRCDYSVRTAKRHLRLLVKAGWLQSERRKADDGANAPTLYRLNDRTN